MALEVVVERDLAQARLLAIAGDLTPGAARDLEQMLRQCLSEGRHSLLLDLSQLESISGAALRVLVMVGERLEAEGGRLALCALSPHVVKVFDVARMTHRFAIHPSRAAALEWLEKSVRMARVARLAGALLRKSDSARPEKRFARRGDAGRTSLAAELLGVDEEDSPAADEADAP